jgi:hypothetical protein
MIPLCINILKVNPLPSKIKNEMAKAQWAHVALWKTAGFIRPILFHDSFRQPQGIGRWQQRLLMLIPRLHQLLPSAKSLVSYRVYRQPTQLISPVEIGMGMLAQQLISPFQP